MRALAAVTALACLFASGMAAAMSAEELFREGNRLFRDDLYWAALLRYEQAAEAGMNTPLLHYNTGVAHYKAGQHSRARASLQQAARSPSLRQLAQYNLGLNAYAAGDSEEALRWFRSARDRGTSEEISSLARTAIARIRHGQVEEDPVYQQAVRNGKRGIFSISAISRASATATTATSSVHRPSPTSTLRTRTCRSSCPWSRPAVTCHTTWARST